MKKLSLLLLSMMFLVYGCGGGDDTAGGGSGVVETVRIQPPEFDKNIINSDVAVWQDKNNDNKICDYVNDTFSTVADTVNVTVKTKSVDGLPEGLPKSPVRIESAEVKYTPMNNNSPAIPTQYYNLSIVIEPDQASTFLLEIVPYQVKLAMQQRLICTDNVYNYYVTVTLKTVEIYSGKRTDIQGHLTLKIGDFPEQ